MTRLRDDVEGGTGDGSDSTATTSSRSRADGRRLAVRVVLDGDSGPTAATDGGLSPAARAWMDATPGVDVEDARRYDREQQVYRDVSRSGPLPPRGSAGHPSNYDRAEQVNTARRSLRKYLDLEERTDTGDE